MKMEAPTEVMIFVLCTLIDWSLTASGDVNYRCQACRAVVDETFFMIDKVDPKKTIQTGSFRVDSHGNQGRYEVPYARSETHLTEVFEEICTNLHNYGETVGDDNIRTIIRTTAKDLKTPVDLSNIEINSEKQRKLINICHNLIEDFEDDMMVVFKNKDVPNDMAEKIICVHKAELCAEEELLHPLPQPKPQTADSVMEEIEKRMSETEPNTARPTREDDNTDKQADEQMDNETPDKTEL